MEEQNSGQIRMVKEMCDSWLMLIMKISGGISNIPTAEMGKIKELRNECINTYMQWAEEKGENNVSDLFWKDWNERCPEYFNFEKYKCYNQNIEKAEKAYREALTYFKI